VIVAIAIVVLVVLVGRPQPKGAAQPEPAVTRTAPTADARDLRPEADGLVARATEPVPPRRATPSHTPPIPNGYDPAAEVRPPAPDPALELPPPPVEPSRTPE
jgi:hypothetical protein